MVANTGTNHALLQYVTVFVPVCQVSKNLWKKWGDDRIKDTPITEVMYCKNPKKTGHSKIQSTTVIFLKFGYCCLTIEPYSNGSDVTQHTHALPLDRANCLEAFSGLMY